MKILLFAIFVLASVNAAPQPQFTIDFEHYWTLDEIYNYMDALAKENPEFVEIKIVGYSYEGREIRGIHIAKEGISINETEVVEIIAGLSSRDWIATMAAVNIIHELIVNRIENSLLIDNISWFVIPVSNPDGFVFSFTEGNRGWVKNRRPNEDSDCIGTSIDRNFDFRWGLENMQNCFNPCCDNHRGTEASSEEETKALQSAIENLKHRQRAYVALKGVYANVHSAIAFPFSFSNEAFTSNFMEMRDIAHVMADYIYRHSGSRYIASSESNIAGVISGTSADYAAAVDRIPLVYSIYLPRANTIPIWDIPAENIPSVVNEIFQAILGLGEYISDNRHF